jgi:L-lactate dehydrogenase complex protein LldG
MLDQNHQNSFIRTVKSALSDLPDKKRKPHPFPDCEVQDSIAKKLAEIQGRSKQDRQVLLHTLIEQSRPLNLNVLPVANSAHAAERIRDLILLKNPEWSDDKQVVVSNHSLVDRLDLDNLLNDDSVRIIRTEHVDDNDREPLRTQIGKSFVGITGADYCVADSATLVLKTRKGQPRSVSLAPSIHIAVIHLKRILADLKELYLQLQWDPEEREEGFTRCLTFITGPSKTADIEAIMVHGAHGPREVHIFVITDI